MKIQILTKRQQRELLIDLAVIQHRVVEALPFMVGVASDEAVKKFMRSCMENLMAVAKAIDPEHGQDFMGNAYLETRRQVEARLKGGNADEAAEKA